MSVMNNSSVLPAKDFEEYVYPCISLPVHSGAGVPFVNSSFSHKVYNPEESESLTDNFSGNLY